MGHEVGVLVNGIGALIERLPCSSSTGRYFRKIIYTPETWLSPDIEYAVDLILDLLAPRPMRNKFLLFIGLD